MVFLLGELEHKILREALTVSFDSLIKHLGRDLVEVCQILIQHNLFISNKMYFSFNAAPQRRLIKLGVFFRLTEDKRFT